MRRMKSTARREHMFAASSFSSEDDLSLGDDQEEVPTSTSDVVSSHEVSQCRDGVPSQRNQFTRRYKAHWKDDISM